MNETPILPDPVVSAAKPAETPNAAPPQPEPSLLETVQQPQTLLVGIVVLAILLAGQTWSSHNQVRNLREEMARACRRDASNAETGAWCAPCRKAARNCKPKSACWKASSRKPRASNWRWNSCIRTCPRTATSGR
jgi:uroporphyrin-3 C-methyltransferase/uroporphyrinogen III methyltransferase/synthase